MSGHDLRSGDVPVEPSGTPVQAGHSAGESAAGPDRRRRPERTRRFSSRARLIVVGLAVALILAIAGVLLVVGNRFSMISPWADVSTALGANFGNIESATLVTRPSAVSVIFEAENAGRHRLWHAVRFSANGGSWRPADDVTAAIARSGVSSPLPALPCRTNISDDGFFLSSPGGK